MTDILKQIHNSAAYAKGAHEQSQKWFSNESDDVANELQSFGVLASILKLEQRAIDVTYLGDARLAFSIHLAKIANNDHAEQFHMQDEYTVIANCCTTDNFTPNDTNDCMRLLH